MARASCPSNPERSREGQSPEAHRADQRAPGAFAQAQRLQHGLAQPIGARLVNQENLDQLGRRSSGSEAEERARASAEKSMPPIRGLRRVAQKGRAQRAK